jgi:hypothetical protein
MGLDLRPRCRALALASVLLTLALPVAAQGAARSLSPSRFPTPASALPQGTTSKSSSATTPAATTPAATSPAGTPRSGSPTTTYNPSTTGAGATPGATSVPGATTTPGATTVPGAATPGAATTPTGALPGARPALVHRAGTGSTSLSTGALVAAVLAALLILACAVWAAVRWYAYEPHWTLSARHSFSEAGLRVSATWGEFADWVRLGR